jgi:hypothetical protein
MLSIIITQISTTSPDTRRRKRVKEKATEKCNNPMPGRDCVNSKRDRGAEPEVAVPPASKLSEKGRQKEQR